MKKYSKGHHQNMKTFGFDRKGGSHDFQYNHDSEEKPIDQKDTVAGTISESETCPLCNRHCLLSDPGCPKGGAYARIHHADSQNDELLVAEQRGTSDQDLESLFKQSIRIMSRYNHRHDYTHHAQRDVYKIIKEKGPMPQKALMEILDIRSASLSEILSKLERRGHIIKQRNEEDKRGFIVAVNEEMTMLDEGRGAKKEDMFSCLNEEETQQLGTLLHKIISSADNVLADRPERRGRGAKLERHGKGGRGQQRSGSRGEHHHR
jgi:DNA-binding MarR family transcriptional regulator